MRKSKISARHYAGAYDPTSGAENISPESVVVSRNMRVTKDGGRRTRDGISESADLATSAYVENMYNHKDELCFAKSGTKILYSSDMTTWYDSGLTRTASDRDAFSTKDREVKISNTTDSFVRGVVAQLGAAIAATHTTITLQAGDVWLFADGAGTVIVNGTAYTYTGRNTGANTLTGVQEGGGVVATAQANGSFALEFTTPANAPKGNTIADFESTTVVAGVAANKSNIHSSATYSDNFPQYSYDFTGNGAHVHPQQRGVTCLFKGTGGLLIGMEGAIGYSLGYDVDTGSLIARNLTTEMGVPNAACIAQFGQYYYAYTGRRFLQVASSEAGTQIMSDGNNVQSAFDSHMRGDLELSDADQLQSYVFADHVNNELILSHFEDSIRYELIIDGDTGMLQSKDTTAFACRVIFKGRVYAGSDSDDKIYLLNDGQTDAGMIIDHAIQGKKYEFPDETVKFRSFNFNGLISQEGEIEFTADFNEGSISESWLITYALLDEQRLLVGSEGDVDYTGLLGHDAMGAYNLGGVDAESDRYKFVFPITFLVSAEVFQPKWEIRTEATFFQLDSSDLVIESKNNFSYPKQ